ncbi:MAG: AtpZ/AtpI family protein [Candidatus Dormibacteraceae bacterium]|nr:hypothetical protein [Candidatus Acidoferrales bacterium]
MGLLIAAAFVGPLLLGLMLDGAAKTSPVFLLAGLLVGIGAAVAVVLARFRRYL